MPYLALRIASFNEISKHNLFRKYPSSGAINRAHLEGATRRNSRDAARVSRVVRPIKDSCQGSNSIRRTPPSLLVLLDKTPSTSSLFSSLFFITEDRRMPDGHYIASSATELGVLLPIYALSIRIRIATAAVAAVGRSSSPAIEWYLT